MNDQWYYADRNQQQQGPVHVAWLQGAYARGEITAASLVWRDGMAAWQPLAQVAAELGIAMAAPPPALPRKAVIVAPKSGSSMLLIVLIVGFVGIFVLGIFLAIAIPAYQDYTDRAKVMQGVAVASGLKLSVSEFMLEHERCPANEESDILAPTAYASGALQAIHVGELADAPEYCEIQLVFDGVSRAGQQDTLSMIYRGPGDWVYRSTLPTNRLPASMRSQVESTP